MIPFNIIVAIDQERGIGKNGELPWHISADLKHFKKITTDSNGDKKNVVIMGRKTWESIPDDFQPLKSRTNVVLTRNTAFSIPNDVVMAASLEEAWKKLENDNRIGSAFIIGGEEIFKNSIALPNCQKLFVTHIEGSFQCDTFFPPFENHFSLLKEGEKQEENGIIFHFSEYIRNP